MTCGKCGGTDIRYFEHAEQHRIIESETDSTIYLSRSFPQDDSIVKEFFECLSCGWQTTEEELKPNGITIVKVGD